MKLIQSFLHAVSLPVAALVDADADADPVKGTQATDRWTPEEDAKLYSAFTNTCNKRYGTEYRKNWIAIAVLVAGSGSSGKSVFDKIEGCLGSQHRSDECMYGYMDRSRKNQAAGYGTNARWQGLT
jgi:hypothetical protein